MDADGELEEYDSDTLVERYTCGESRAFGEIWRRHHRRMRGIARGYLQSYEELSRLYEADDFLSEVVGRMTKRVLRGKYTQKIRCANDFWMHFRKVLRQCVREEHQRLSAAKRGGGGAKKPVGVAKLRDVFGARLGRPAVPDDLDLIESGELGPDAVAMIEEVIGRLFALLDEEQAVIARFRLANTRIPEIAAEMGLSERTIARRLDEIRRSWGRSGLLG